MRASRRALSLPPLPPPRKFVAVPFIHQRVRAVARTTESYFEHRGLALAKLASFSPAGEMPPSARSPGATSASMAVAEASRRVDAMRDQLGFVISDELAFAVLAHNVAQGRTHAAVVWLRRIADEQRRPLPPALLRSVATLLRLGFHAWLPDAAALTALPPVPLATLAPPPPSTASSAESDDGGEFVWPTAPPSAAAATVGFGGSPATRNACLEVFLPAWTSLERLGLLFSRSALPQPPSAEPDSGEPSEAAAALLLSPSEQDAVLALFGEDYPVAAAAAAALVDGRAAYCDLLLAVAQAAAELVSFDLGYALLATFHNGFLRLGAESADADQRVALLGDFWGGADAAAAFADAFLAAVYYGRLLAERSASVAPGATAEVPPWVADVDRRIAGLVRAHRALFPTAAPYVAVALADASLLPPPPGVVASASPFSESERRALAFLCDARRPRDAQAADEGQAACVAAVAHALEVMAAAARAPSVDEATSAEVSGVVALALQTQLAAGVAPGRALAALWRPGGAWALGGERCPLNVMCLSEILRLLAAQNLARSAESSAPAAFAAEEDAALEQRLLHDVVVPALLALPRPADGDVYAAAALLLARRRDWALLRRLLDGLLSFRDSGEEKDAAAASDGGGGGSCGALSATTMRLDVFAAVFEAARDDGEAQLCLLLRERRTALFY